MNNLNQYPDAPRSLEYENISMPSWDSGTVFNKNTSFIVENYGLVKMFFLLITVVPDGATVYPSKTAAYIIENVFLECNGVPFCRANTTYTLHRIDATKSSGLFDKLERSTTLQGTFDSVQTIALPLFFCVIDQKTFEVANYDNITVRVTTKANKEAMGFSIDPLSLSFKLSTNYDQIIGKSSISSELKDTYNITSESYPILALETSKSIKLGNPSKCKSLIFMIRANSTARIAVSINSIKIRFTNGQEKTYSNLTNYNFSNIYGDNDGTIFTIDYDYLKLNGNMNPVECTVYFASLYDATLFVVYEYHSIIMNKGKMLMESFEQSLY